MYIVFEVTAIVALVTAAVVALTCADSSSTDKFIQDTVWDVFTTMKNDRNVEADFGNMEKRLQCCGASSPRDYINWRRDFPVSCCDTYYHGWIGEYNIDCDFTNKLANERHGCTEVATNYTRIIIRVLSGACAFTAFLGLMNLIVAVTLSKSMKRRPKPMPVQLESESKKGLL
ncbi:hypothetical protein HW555_013098 [Spodoptera exigua]|nr:hypothetical protein HW555_013098 [Spodoptera exigua]